MSHTPGPWRAEMRFPPIRYVIQDDCNDTVAKTYGQPEQKADALLLAAAPELLEALQDLMSYANESSPVRWHQAKANARAAIAKALGQ